MHGVWNSPLATIVIGLLLAMLAGHELGMWAYGRLRRRDDNRGSGSSDEGFILSGGLGLLVLLMAFTFSMSVDRFEDRRELMLRETSALGNLALVSSAARTVTAREIVPLLRRYAQARLHAAQLPEGNERANALRSASGLRDALRAAVNKSVAEDAGLPSAVALASAFDGVEDSAVRRDAMTAAHLPERVLSLLASYCIVAAAMLGYAVASGGSRHRAASTCFYLLLSLAFGTVVDLDRSRSGAITVPQQPFEDAVLSLSHTGLRYRPSAGARKRRECPQWVESGHAARAPFAIDARWWCWIAGPPHCHPGLDPGPRANSPASGL